MDFDQESKFGKIYKVAGPCKLLLSFLNSFFPTFLFFVPFEAHDGLMVECSGGGREYVWINDVRVGEGGLGQVGGRNH